MSRSIIVVSPASNKPRTIVSNATTFGQLCENCEFSSIYNDGLQAVIGGSKLDIRDNDSVLPTGDFNLFLVAKKNKAGAETLSESLNDAIEEAIDAEDVADRYGKADVSLVLDLVKSAVNTFFAAGVEASLSAAETKALSDYKKL